MCLWSKLDHAVQMQPTSTDQVRTCVVIKVKGYTVTKRPAQVTTLSDSQDGAVWGTIVTTVVHSDGKLIQAVYTNISNNSGLAIVTGFSCS